MPNYRSLFDGQFCRQHNNAMQRTVHGPWSAHVGRIRNSVGEAD